MAIPLETLKKLLLEASVVDAEEEAIDEEVRRREERDRDIIHQEKLAEEEKRFQEEDMQREREIRHGDMSDEEWKKLSRAEKRQHKRAEWEVMTPKERRYDYVGGVLNKRLDSIEGYKQHKKDGLHEKLYSPERIKWFEERVAMTPEQLGQDMQSRGEVLERRLQRRERLYELESSRANLVVLSQEVRRRSTRTGRLTKSLRKSTKSLDNKTLFEKQEAARKEYTGLREKNILLKTFDHFFGEEASEMRRWLALNERMRMAEGEALEHQQGIFEKVRKTWRKLTDLNVEAGLRKAGKGPKSKLGKFVSRMVSARTAAGVGLLGFAGVVGSGGVGMAAVAARRVLSGTSAAFGFYDLMRNFSDQKALKLSQEDVDKMKENPPAIAQKITELEARAMFSGERMVHSDEYSMLRKAYIECIASAEDTEPEKLEALRKIDEVLVLKQDEIYKQDKKYKRRAAGAGLLFALTPTILRGVLGNSAEIQDAISGVIGSDSTEATGAITEDSIAKLVEVRQDVLDTFPVLSSEMVEEIDAAAILPDEMLDSAANFVVLDSEAFHEVHSMGLPEGVEEGVRVETGDPQSLAEEGSTGVEVFETEGLEAEIAAEEAVLVEIEVISGSVEAGGSASQAVHDMVKEGVISQEQLNEAWNSSYSMVELADGEKIHISQLGLTHTGDRIVFVPETNDIPSHFMVNPDSGFDVGSNQDLYEAMVQEGRNIPKWLEHKMEAAGVIPEIPDAPESISVPPMDLADVSSSIPDSAAFGLEELAAPPGDSVEVMLDKSIGIGDESVAGGTTSSEFIGPPEEGVLNTDEAIAAAAEGTLQVSENVLETTWGGARFVYDAEGNVADILVSETATGDVRELLLAEAKEQVLHSNFVSTLEYGTSEQLQHIVMPERIRAAEEGAWEIYRLLNIMNAGLESGSIEKQSAEFYFLRWKINSVLEFNNLRFNNRIYDIGRFYNLLQS